MTNGEKYKTAEERTKAFYDFCSIFFSCSECPFYNDSEDIECKVQWLELEYKELKPCPFCGGEADAIEQWNRRV